ncbi:transcriptional regulator [Photobacterium ganghwense]|uniref:Transcriptional regulator n=1 Tax=Photobacterium ganghwense TaxID=320778 RepID=A0A0J1GXE1_9GAMM|nr:winged helix-turn-helix domain-containing protein [Photobacterium ganghwense]KLV04338.1 transcriptional regulator [Photobacterium ganghwense]MBV1840892.1 winged helix-turn-helix domain-containing protein [Photobacterium ganghwense]PSU08033.1 winged helix family transcriptional regulator [Photobacterium ganghwense]QSV14842.1 winged helix-turn-helix domain-containing protein [Photobacterium ganghwense]
MKYKINDFLFYDVTDATLSLNDSGVSDTQLSITANALLYFLIQHPGIITRDEVMKKVWDDNGLTSSNGNLNQYLSMLRKAFRFYDIDNIVVSVPRGRIEINPDLVIEIVDDCQLHPLIQQEEEDGTATEQPVSPLLSPSPKKQPLFGEDLPPQTEEQEKNWLMASAVLFTGALVLLWTAIISERSINILQLNQVQNSVCELFSTEKMINDEMQQSYNHSFTAVTNALGIECNKERRFVFYYGDKFQNKGLGRTFLAQCAKNENNPYAYCDNYFYYSWK